MKPIDIGGFECKFQETVDPWDYRSSSFEARKRRELLQACGLGIHGRGLELACAIGATSRVLATRCLTLVATDGAPTALAEARRLTPVGLRIDYRQGVLPRDMPRGPFDLVVVSEIAYYLSHRDLRDLARSILYVLAPGRLRRRGSSPRPLRRRSPTSGHRTRDAVSPSRTPPAPRPPAALRPIRGRYVPQARLASPGIPTRRVVAKRSSRNPRRAADLGMQAHSRRHAEDRPRGHPAPRPFRQDL